MFYILFCEAFSFQSILCKQTGSKGWTSCEPLWVDSVFWLCLNFVIVLHGMFPMYPKGERINFFYLAFLKKTYKFLSCYVGCLTFFSPDGKRLTNMTCEGGENKDDNEHQWRHHWFPSISSNKRSTIKRIWWTSLLVVILCTDMRRNVNIVIN